MSKSNRYFVYAVLVCLCVTGYWVILRGSLDVRISASGTEVQGALLTVTGTYSADGKLYEIEHFRGQIKSNSSQLIELPAMLPWTFHSMKVQVEHPNFRPSKAYPASNPYWRNQTLTLQLALWSRSLDNYVVEASESTSAEGLDHLRWLRADYLEAIPTAIAIREIMAAQLALGSLAMAGGRRDGAWEETRQDALRELDLLKEIIEQRSHDPCPDGHQTAAERLAECGRSENRVIWPDQ